MNHEMYSSQVENRSIMPDVLKSNDAISYHSSVYKFRDIEEVIQLSHRLTLPFFNTRLLRYDLYYYLVVMLPEQRVMRSNDWVENLILEYGERGSLSIHRLQEYGKTILSENAIATMVKYFKL